MILTKTRFTHWVKRQGQSNFMRLHGYYKL